MADKRVLDLGNARFGLVNVPKTLYKFFNDPAHAHGFVSRGRLRIGTLYDFRRSESHDAARADPAEGRFDYIHQSAFPELITKENAPPYLSGYFAQILQSPHMAAFSPSKPAIQTATYSAQAAHPEQRLPATVHMAYELMMYQVFSRS